MSIVHLNKESMLHSWLEKKCKKIFVCIPESGKFCTVKIRMKKVHSENCFQKLYNKQCLSVLIQKQNLCYSDSVNHSCNIYGVYEFRCTFLVTHT